MKQHKRKEDAVSPVIGVMLMLVVTLVIAAVVTAFATGMAGDSTATTPMALFEAGNQQVVSGSVGDRQTYLLQTFDLVHKGGDEIELENIKVVIDPKGGMASYGIMVVKTKSDLTVPGKTGDDVVLSTGDRIRIKLNTGSDHEKSETGSLVKWTLSDTRTNGVIAKGEFVVPKA
ncbi:MAG: type IV pilin [Methanocorpusculum parvum]|nr:type IV pilin [Methanocorpusculum parvum]